MHLITIYQHLKQTQNDMAVSQQYFLVQERLWMSFYIYLYKWKKCSPRCRKASVHARKIASKGWMSGLAENKANKSEVQESAPSAKQNMEHDKVCHVWCAASAHNSISQSCSNATLNLFSLHLEFDITITIILSFCLVTPSLEWRLLRWRLHVRMSQCSAQGLCQQVSCK